MHTQDNTISALVTDGSYTQCTISLTPQVQMCDGRDRSREMSEGNGFKESWRGSRRILHPLKVEEDKDGKGGDSTVEHCVLFFLNFFLI